jgi:hemolysin activation/secretion protein
MKLPATLVSRTLLSFGLLLPVLSPGVSQAQTPADLDAAQRQLENIQRQEQDRVQRDQEEARQRGGRVQGLDTQKLQPKINVPALGVACRDIRIVSLKGAAHIPAWEQQIIIDKFVNRCLNVSDIENLLAEVTKYYLERGFITTRAYLPPQDLSQGQLEILVIEGIVEKIVIEDGGAKSVSLLNVFPGVEGRVLNLRDLEQGIDQINRLSSNRAQLDIQPGDKPGASRVVVRNQPVSPWHLSLSNDNQGSTSTGKNQTGLTVSTDNLLGFNDLLSATRRESTPNYRGSQYSASDSLSFSLPLGYTTLSFGSSYSVYDSTIRVPSGLALIAHGNNQTDNVRLDRVIYRDQATRAALSATLTTKKSKNYLDDQFLGVSSRNLTVLDLDSNLSVNFAGGTLALDLGYAMGLNKAGALTDPDYLPDWAARAQFSKIKAGFNYNRPFTLLGKSASFSSQFSGQKANDTLYGSEQISIGGIYSVRGFVKNTLAGDDGYYWRNEFSVRQPLSIGDETVATRFYIGYDTGEVRNRTANIPEGRLSGLVLGLSANWRGATWDLFATQPLNLPGDMQKEPSQTWFRVTYSF